MNGHKFMTYIKRLRLNCSQYGRHIITILPTIWSYLTIWWTMLWQYASPFCQFWQHCEIFSPYGETILLSYMIAILSKLTIRCTILSQNCLPYCQIWQHCWQYCNNIVILWTIFQLVMVKAGDVYTVCNACLHKK